MADIRVGMIRCDTHGMWYGPLFQKHDPLLFREPMPVDEPMTDTWQRGGNHYYFYTHYCDPKRMTAPTIDGFELVQLWDADRRTAEMAARVFYNRPKVCRSFEEVCEGVDLVFINDCNGEGEDHLQLASPGLKKGVATFIDKPFAYTLADAHELLRLADEHRAPLMSMSMMRVAPAVMWFRNRLPETGGVQFGTVSGGGTALAGLIHGVTLAHAVFGDGIESVHVLPARNHTSVHLDYGDREDRPKHGVLIHCDAGRPPHSAFYAQAFGPRRMIHSVELGDWENPSSAVEVLKAVKQLVQTKQSLIQRHETIESIAVAEAFRQSRETGRAVNVRQTIERSLKS